MHEDKIKEIYHDIREFYKAAVKYLKEKSPFKEELLRHAEVFDLERLPKMTFSSIRYFVERFPGPCFIIETWYNECHSTILSNDTQT